MKQNLRSSTLHRFEGKSKKEENLNYFVEFHVRLVILYCTFDFYAMYAILQYFCKEKICKISISVEKIVEFFLAVLISPFCFGCVVDGVFEGYVLKLFLCFLLFSMVAKLIEPCNPVVMVVVDFP